jgi:predicted HD phosphohydrolase
MVEIEVIIFSNPAAIRREAIHVYSKEFLDSVNQAYFKFCARASTDLDPKGLINSSAVMKI